MERRRNTWKQWNNSGQLQGCVFSERRTCVTIISTDRVLDITANGCCSQESEGRRCRSSAGARLCKRFSVEGNISQVWLSACWGWDHPFGLLCTMCCVMKPWLLATGRIVLRVITIIVKGKINYGEEWLNCFFYPSILPEKSQCLLLLLLMCDLVLLSLKLIAKTPVIFIFF